MSSTTSEDVRSTEFAITDGNVFRLFVEEHSQTDPKDHVVLSREKLEDAENAAFRLFESSRSRLEAIARQTDTEHQIRLIKTMGSALALIEWAQTVDTDSRRQYRREAMGILVRLREEIGLLLPGSAS